MYLYKTLLTAVNLKLMVRIENNIFEHKIAIIFLSISWNMCFGAQMNSLDETVPLSTHNMFLLRNKKKNFSYSYLGACTKKLQQNWSAKNMAPRGVKLLKKFIWNSQSEFKIICQKRSLDDLL